MKFVHGDAAKMPFEDDSFDKLITVNTIYFWDDAKAVTLEIKRVLKPGGKLVLGLRPAHFMKTYPMTGYGFKLYSANDIKKLLESNDFKMVLMKEETEPPQEVEGEMLELASLVVTAYN